jgi:lipopolysaccharide export system protein LptC
MIENHISKDESEARLERLSRYRSERSGNSSESYSALIRRMRIILPLFAMAIIAALMAWPSMDNKISVLKEEQTASLQTIRKNELTGPKFESVDEKSQPYTLTALRAVQDEQNEEIMHLEQPEGKLALNSGEQVGLKADKGIYYQVPSQLKLNENVRLLHSEGYEMSMTHLDIDMKAGTAETDSNIEGNGPAGTLKAQGMNADNNAGILVFHGPAKLTLKESGSLQGLRGTQP